VGELKMFQMFQTLEMIVISNLVPAQFKKLDVGEVGGDGGGILNLVIIEQNLPD
jgi:hypothetical protein